MPSILHQMTAIYVFVDDSSRRTPTPPSGAARITRALPSPTPRSLPSPSFKAAWAPLPSSTPIALSRPTYTRPSPCCPPMPNGSLACTPYRVSSDNSSRWPANERPVKSGSTGSTASRSPWANRSATAASTSCATRGPPLARRASVGSSGSNCTFSSSSRGRFWQQSSSRQLVGRRGGAGLVPLGEWRRRAGGPGVPGIGTLPLGVGGSRTLSGDTHGGGTGERPASADLPV